MIPCGCGSPVRPGGPCPECGAPAPSTRAPSAAALLLGLALAGCAGEKSTDSMQAEYGVTVTDSQESPPDTADTGQ